MKTFIKDDITSENETQDLWDDQNEGNVVNMC